MNPLAGHYLRATLWAKYILREAAHSACDSACRHIDLWDAVENQNFFSFEAFQHVLDQLGNIQRQPDIPTPYYKTLRKFKQFEIRRSAMLIALAV